MREVSWGEAMVVAVFHHGPGLKGAVDRITATVGPHIGVRNTFAKLYSVTDPAALPQMEQFRAWLLLTALDETPADWGIPDAVVPPGLDIERLRELLPCPRQDSNLRPKRYLIRSIRAAHLPLRAALPVAA